jgi:HlyD family secretion protein
MWRQLIIPAVAVGALAFAVTHVVRSQQTPPAKEPLVEPPRSPFGRSVAGAGLVEARTENIAVGSLTPGVVVDVAVKVGQQVRAGDELFRLDDRQCRAEVRLREANLAAAKAQLDKLLAMPRPEEVPPAEAKVLEAKANLADMEDQERRTKQTVASGAATAEEYNRRKQATEIARQQLERAKAELYLLRSGAWSADLEVSRAAVAQTEAQVGQARTDLDRLRVQAPLDGRVLQVNVRPGEFVGAPPAQALVVLGNLDRLHVRVDIDENDIHRFRPGAPAVAALRGDPKQTFPLTFVRVEPYVIPKKALTGDNVERVDTRVLQVIYAIDPRGKALYVGQQLDVFQEVTD